MQPVPVPLSGRTSSVICIQQSLHAATTQVGCIMHTTSAAAMAPSSFAAYWACNEALGACQPSTTDRIGSSACSKPCRHNLLSLFLYITPVCVCFWYCRLQDQCPLLSAFCQGVQAVCIAARWLIVHGGVTEVGGRQGKPLIGASKEA